MTNQLAVTRRRLLGAGGGLLAAAALPALGTTTPAAAASAAPTRSSDDPQRLPAERIGIQLYTVRDQIQKHGFAVVLEHLSAMGFREVEFAGYTQGSGPITLKQLRRLLDDNGLRAVGAHTDATPDNIERVLDQAEALGMAHVGIADAPQVGYTVSDWQASADQMNKMGQAATKRGLKFYWHNHDTEFSPCADSPTTRSYDVLLEHTDPKLVYMEMDIYWAFVGQYMYSSEPLGTFDPVDYVAKHKDRYPLFHVKDGKLNHADPQGYEIVDVGQGGLEFNRLLGKLAKQPLKHHYLNENDVAYQQPRGSIESARCSYLYMRNGIVIG